MSPVVTGGVVAIVAGVLVSAASVAHPNVLQGDVPRLVLETRGWVAIHLATAASVVAGWWAVRSTVQRHRARWGRRGDAVVLATAVGAHLLVAVMVVEAVAYEAIARHAPELLTFDGPLAGALPLRAVLAVGGLYFAGLVGLGVLLRAEPGWRGVGTGLVVATVAYVTLAGPFLPVVGPMAMVGFGAAQVWWGCRLLAPADAGGAGTTGQKGATWVAEPVPMGSAVGVDVNREERADG